MCQYYKRCSRRLGIRCGIRQASHTPSVGVNNNNNNGYLTLLMANPYNLVISLLLSAFPVHSTSFSPKPFQPKTAKMAGTVKIRSNVFHPDMTKTVDWALKTNFLPTSLLHLPDLFVYCFPSRLAALILC